MAECCGAYGSGQCDYVCEVAEKVKLVPVDEDEDEW